MWEDEASFQDVRDRQNLERDGWKKIERFCAVARKWDWEYAWVDTCCIDKTSSSELNEAINSMYTWYSKAEECYAYLSDVPSDLAMDEKTEALRRSKWFTRGWTLQELLAPSEVYFFDKNWKMIGTKTKLKDDLSEITGIFDVAILDTSTISVATKMSWASNRICSREEDHAYCLMGLFGIDMPLLYGEGENAFKRLQLEILKISDDESLFAWWHPEDDLKFQSGLLAASPRNFWNSRDITPYPFYPDREPYDMTNKGLRVEASLIPCQFVGQGEGTRPDPFHRPEKLPSNNALSTLEDLEGRDRFRGDLFRPSETREGPDVSLTGERIWIFPLNCRAKTNDRPIILILAEWGSKKGQCCRLYSKKMTDESFGPEWSANWKVFADITRPTYIREAEREASLRLARSYTPAWSESIPARSNSIPARSDGIPARSHRPQDSRT
jgi:Heterokaryon incompatibility protein (HET)